MAAIVHASPPEGDDLPGITTGATQQSSKREGPDGVASQAAKFSWVPLSCSNIISDQPEIVCWAGK